MPDFQNPAAFLLLLLIPLLFILRKAGIFTKISLFITISDWDGKTFRWDKKFFDFFSIFARALSLMGFLSAVIALSQPVIYKQERIYTSRGTDILFVLDVSPSMAARDIAGERRIDAAKKCVIQLVNESAGSSFGLVAMAGEASIVVPPTMDHKLFIQRLNAVSIGSLGDGTAIGTGLSTAIFHLSSSTAPKKAIILVTDGENNAGSIHPETASMLAIRNNIAIYTLGLGTTGTVPIDYVDPKTGKNYSGFLNSVFDVSSLNQIAKIGGGRNFEIQSLGDLSQALTLISRNESSIQSYHSKTTSVDYYEVFCFTSGILIALSYIIKKIFLEEFV